MGTVGEACFALLEEAGECTENAGVAGQVGSTWVHASGLGVEGIREYCERLSETLATPFHVAGYAMVEALRMFNAEKVALIAVHHWPDWRQWNHAVAYVGHGGRIGRHRVPNVRSAEPRTGIRICGRRADD